MLRTWTKGTVCADGTNRVTFRRVLFYTVSECGYGYVYMQGVIHFCEPIEKDKGTIQHVRTETCGSTSMDSSISAKRGERGIADWSKEDGCGKEE